MNHYLLSNLDLFSGHLNGEVKNNSSIEIENGRIKEIYDGIPSGFFDEIINLKGKFAIPGLINSHCHLMLNGSPDMTIKGFSVYELIRNIKNDSVRNIVLESMLKNSQEAINSGITTLVSLGDKDNIDKDLKNIIKNTDRVFPKIISSGNALLPVSGHGDILGTTCTDPMNFIEEIRNNILNEAEIIKIMVTGGVMDSKKIGEAGTLKMKPSEIYVSVKEAHRRGLLVCAHVQSTTGIYEALKGGVDIIEHGAEIDDDLILKFKNDNESLRGYSALNPTLSASIEIMNNFKSSESSMSHIQYKNTVIVYERISKGFIKALENGIKISMGNDAGVPFVYHRNFWKELKYRVEKSHGLLNNKKALHLATLNNARLFSLDNDIGSIEKGKKADLIILNENPLKNLEHLKDPFMVIKDGKIVNTN